jgi:hypothetical protein
MQLFIPHAWTWFCLLLAVVLLTSFVMATLGRRFFTLDVVLRSFSILDLEWPASPLEIVNLIKGIYLLPAPDSRKVIKALRAQLYIDYLFMPAAYGSIFILCMQVSWKMPPAGAAFFSVLAFLQVIPWLCDIIENFFLLGKIRPDTGKPGKTVFRAYQCLEIAKWGLSLLGLVCGLSSLLYFWLSGHYAFTSLHYLLIIAAEIGVFFFAMR